MDSILNNERFAETFRQLAGVSLNPRRHTAANALEHSEAVAARAVALARANDCTEPATRLLENLGRAHDIGKVTGTARPERSLEVLRTCGIAEPALLALPERTHERRWVGREDVRTISLVNEALRPLLVAALESADAGTSELRTHGAEPAADARSPQATE
jgi:hypothetical protein